MARATTYLSSAIAAAFVFFAFFSTCQGAGTPEQRRACTQDALKFCGDKVPDVPRITECMKTNIRKLSPLCSAQFK